MLLEVFTWTFPVAPDGGADPETMAMVNVLLLSLDATAPLVAPFTELEAPSVDAALLVARTIESDPSDMLFSFLSDASRATEGRLDDRDVGR